LLVLPAIFFGALFVLATTYALGVIFLWKTPAPPEIALALGLAVESFLVFLLLLAGAAFPPAFLAIGAAACISMIWIRSKPLPETAAAPLGNTGGIAAAIILGAYGAWYFVNALAPETSPDGVTYHLGNAAEFARLGGFPAHITFYDMAPQGMEMLYTVAFAFGRHSAAKLVEFAIFLATIPLIFRVSRRLGMSDLSSLTAAAFYFCAPVAGIVGSSSYNDAAEVFFALSAFYLLLVWRDTRDSRYLLPVGVCAGFCYAIKFPGIMAVIGAVLFVMAHRRAKAAAWVATGAALAIAPWILRDLALTGNPVAPLMNGVFPNPYFHLATERELAANLRSLGGVQPWGVPWQLAFGDRLTGTFGPLLLVLPLGLLALPRRQGRLCWAAAVILAVPWFVNTGARFLMPAVALAALPLGMSLPRPAAWAAIMLQAALCWPQTIDMWETRYAFRLHEFPWRAALRLDSEPEYIASHVEQYGVAKMVERLSPPGARILALFSVANAYLDREVAVTWQSAEGERLLDGFRVAGLYRSDTLFDWKAEWPAQPLRGLRVRLPVSSSFECDIYEVELYSDEDRVYNSPQWTLRAWPNPWETPLAFDGNRVTRWRTWGPAPAGTFLEIGMNYPQRLSAAVLLSHTPVFRVPIEFDGQDAGGRWRLLSQTAARIARPPQDFRIDVAEALRRAGYDYLLVPTGEGGNAPIGNLIVGHAADWGLELVDNAGPYYLLRVR
jgi:4-amino-4-deoxy-L-arabinose transferase-like glycosyltransferase